MKRLIRYLPLIVMTLLALAPHLLAQSTNRVALVVSFGDGNVVTQCVEFSEPEITGLEVLQRAGMSVEAQVQGLGAAVCRIDGTGCPSDNCFCQCTGGGSCRFWNYWHLVNGSWQFSQVGGGIYPVHDGAVEGWAWGVSASNGQGDRPPVYQFEEICAAPVTDTPWPTETAPPTNTAVALTHTPLPTAVHKPEIDFRADATTLVAGSCTILRWDVEYITAVFLNDMGVEGHGSQEVCPAQNETYTLHIIHPQGEENRQITVSVIVPTVTMAVLPTQIVAQAPVNNQVTAASAPATAALPAAATTTVAITGATTTSIPVEPTVTAVPTWQATATYQVVPIDIPLLPTATAPATAVAELPAATLAPATPEPTNAAIPVNFWLSYAIFGMIVAGLGVMLFLAKR